MGRCENYVLGYFCKTSVVIKPLLWFEIIWLGIAIKSTLKFNFAEGRKARFLAVDAKTQHGNIILKATPRRIKIENYTNSSFHGKKLKFNIEKVWINTISALVGEFPAACQKYTAPTGV